LQKWEVAGSAEQAVHQGDGSRQVGALAAGEAGGDRCVAVLAAVAGQMPASVSDAAPSHAVSAILIHGTQDSVASIAGGPSRHRGPNGDLRGWALITWTVFGGGHTWPGTPVPPEYTEPVSLEFDAAEVICRIARPLLIPAKERKL
jgi:polyhydroxybutyrate depolymerase